MKNNVGIKILLSILLLVCLFNMPYGYYQVVRFIAMITFAYLAFNADKENNRNEIWIYIFLALLFQPFIKIALGRLLWNVVDVIVAIGLISDIIRRSTKK
jgi:hypothetical protein